MRAVALCGTAVAALIASPAAAAQTPGGGEIVQATPAQATRTTAYDAAFFAQYAPRTALDIVQRVPGFSLDLGNTELRGFAGAAGNVVVNGQRPSTKSETLDAFLGRIPASRVKRVEVGAGDLYGAEYSSKSQVVNLILSEGGGLAGNATLVATRHWFGKVVPNASASVSLSRGPSTFSLSVDTARGDYFEEGYDRLTDYATGEQLEYRKKFNSIYPHDPVLSGSWSLENADDRAIHLNARVQPSRFILRQSNHVIPTEGAEHDDRLIEDYKIDIFELGGDVTRPLGGGAVKLVGLANRTHRTNRDEYLAGNLGPTEVVGGFEQLARSQRNESIGRLSWTKSKLLGFSFETGAEVAWNTLVDDLDLSVLEPDGGKTPVDLPIDHATVSELRGEFYVNAGRSLGKQLRMDVGLNYEKSRLKVRGDAIANRNLGFFKPSVTLDWHPAGGWHGQLILRRSVAQLDFYDFISAAELSNGRINGGNADLQPQRSWEARVSAEHPLFGDGKARLELGYNLISKLQDRILTDEGFDAPGNIGTGRQAFADLTLDAPLDRFWKGLRVRVHGNVQSTRVHDPISGALRDFSGFYPRWQWDADVRRDAGKFAYGLSVGDRARITFFRTDEFDTNFNRGLPFTSAFVEYRPTSRSSITLNGEDVSDTAGARHRLLFLPDRTAGQPALDEYRFRNSHVRVSLTFKRSFGGSGVAKSQ